jgi:transcriptional regulator with XRE-family HTH domain
MQPIVAQIIDTASRQGINQKTLASHADVAEETLSRLKKGGNPTLDVVERLANVAGLELAMVPRGAARGLPSIGKKRTSFRQRHSALVWSNPNADDHVFLAKALLNPSFHVLLDAALEYGVERLASEWARLKEEGSAEALRALPHTQRILGHIANGYEQAAA